MSKFWTVVTTVFVMAVVLLFVGMNSNRGGIHFTDLETECQYNHEEDVNIDLNHDNSLSFSGQYRIESTRAELDYNYRQSSDRIILDVKTTKIIPLPTYWDNCRGMVVYDAKTSQLEEGTYRVTVRHNGETVDNRVIGIR